MFYLFRNTSWMGLYKFKDEFFLHMLYRFQNGNYLTHIFFLGNKEKAEEFEYDVYIQDAATKKEKFSYSTADIPLIDMSSSEIKRNKMGLLLTEEIARRCVDDKKLILNYQLKKISNFDSTSSASAGPSPKIPKTEFNFKEELDDDFKKQLNDPLLHRPSNPPHFIML